MARLVWSWAWPIFVIAAVGLGIVTCSVGWPLNGPPRLLNEALGSSKPFRYEGQIQFTKFLEDRFPIGSSASALRSMLLVDGFHFPPPAAKDCVPEEVGFRQGKSFIPCPKGDPNKTLEYNWGGLLCGFSADVQWSSDDADHLTHVEGHYGGACP